MFFFLYMFVYSLMVQLFRISWLQFFGQSIIDIWGLENVCENPLDVEFQNDYRRWWWCHCCHILAWGQQFSGFKGNSISIVSLITFCSCLINEIRNDLFCLSGVIWDPFECQFGSSWARFTKLVWTRRCYWSPTFSFITVLHY